MFLVVCEVINSLVHKKVLILFFSNPSAAYLRNLITTDLCTTLCATLLETLPPGYETFIPLYPTASQQACAPCYQPSKCLSYGDK
jgi:hypothetical protein